MLMIGVQKEENTMSSFTYLTVRNTAKVLEKMNPCFTRFTHLSVRTLSEVAYMYFLFYRWPHIKHDGDHNTIDFYFYIFYK